MHLQAFLLFPEQRAEIPKISFCNQPRCSSVLSTFQLEFPSPCLYCFILKKALMTVSENITHKPLDSLICNFELSEVASDFE